MTTRKRDVSISDTNSKISDEEPASKRLKSSTPETESAMEPDGVVDVYADGDVLLVVKGIAGVDKPISIRTSSHALSIGSSVFKNLLTSSPPSSPDFPTTLHLPDDDGDAIFLLCNILHLRNDALPPRLPPNTLHTFIHTAVKYNAIVAASRSTTPWLDSIYNNKILQYSPDPHHTLKMLEAAYLLDDAVYFARFSTRWVIQQTLGQSVEKVVEGIPGRKRLAAELVARQKEGINALKVDLDLLVDAAADGLAEDSKHFIDVAPGCDPEEEDAESCTIDVSAATTYLSALRSANIFPATRWSNSILSITTRIADFRIPSFDSSDECSFCVGVPEKFATALGIVKELQKDRLWGLCLDCYKAGGQGLGEGECRVEHAKGRGVDPGALVRALSASVGSEGRREG